jgi:hypothetical protein
MQFTRSAALQPEQRVHRFPPDSQLEIKARLARQRLPGRADGLRPRDPAAAADRRLEQVAVNAEILCTVVQDDQVAEARKCPGKGDRALVNGENRRALAAGDLGAVDRRRSRAETGPHGAGSRPVELAAERGERQGFNR